MGGTRAEAAVTGTARWPAASLGAPRDRAANLSGDRCATWAKSTEATRLSCRAFWTWSQDRLRPSQGNLSRRTAAQSSCSGSGHVGRQRLACSRSTHVFSSLGRRERSGRVARLTSAGVPGSRSSAPRLPPGRQPRPPARGDGTRLSEDLRRPPAKRSLGHRADARGLRRLGAPARHPHSDHTHVLLYFVAETMRKSLRRASAASGPRSSFCSSSLTREQNFLSSSSRISLNKGRCCQQPGTGRPCGRTPKCCPELWQGDLHGCRGVPRWAAGTLGVTGR